VEKVQGTGRKEGTIEESKYLLHVNSDVANIITIYKWTEQVERVWTGESERLFKVGPVSLTLHCPSS
jgi:hypothetical protein